jgi:hypothetical protein
VQLPQDASQHLAVIAPWLATLAVSGQEWLHAGEGFVGELEHRAAPGLEWFQERDAIGQHHHQQQSAAAVLEGV